MLLPLCNRCKPLHSGHIKILMNFINQTLCVKMKNKATLQFILTPCGFNFGGNKICFSLQRPPSYVLQAGIFVSGEYIKHFLNPIGRRGPVILAIARNPAFSLIAVFVGTINQLMSSANMLKSSSNSLPNNKSKYLRILSRLLCAGISPSLLCDDLYVEFHARASFSSGGCLAGDDATVRSAPNLILDFIFRF